MNLENESRGYQQLLDEIEQEQDELENNVIYLLTGALVAKKLSEQEYSVFVERSLNQTKFGDIAYSLGISDSTARVYYHRALQKMKLEAARVTGIYLRK
tara:strand:+ start:91 stop:387 length:297 start_codon:yes stop_codon:yes gene_type:complete